MYVKNQHKANQYNLKNLMLIFLYIIILKSKWDLLKQF